LRVCVCCSDSLCISLMCSICLYPPLPSPTPARLLGVLPLLLSHSCGRRALLGANADVAIKDNEGVRALRVSSVCVCDLTSVCACVRLCAGESVRAPEYVYA
jgi:hypothetical protein